MLPVFNIPEKAQRAEWKRFFFLLKITQYIPLINREWVHYREISVSVTIITVYIHHCIIYNLHHVTRKMYKANETTLSIYIFVIITPKSSCRQFWKAYKQRWRSLVNWFLWTWWRWVPSLSFHVIERLWLDFFKHLSLNIGFSWQQSICLS